MKIFSCQIFSTLFGIVIASSAFAASTNNAPEPKPNAKGFYHPGVLVNRAQLDFIKNKIATGAEPWKSAFEPAKASNLGALVYTPSPRAEVVCGPRSKPDLGCKDEQRDSEAAYTQALLWYLSGDKTYAENAIKI